MIKGCGVIKKLDDTEETSNETLVAHGNPVFLMGETIDVDESGYRDVNPVTYFAPLAMAA